MVADEGYSFPVKDGDLVEELLDIIESSSVKGMEYIFESTVDPDIYIFDDSSMLEDVYIFTSKEAKVDKAKELEKDFMKLEILDREIEKNLEKFYEEHEVDKIFEKYEGLGD